MVVVCFLTPALAQVATTITPDSSLGTRVGQNGTTYTIEGGTVRGTNQFHSFHRFDVGTGDTAHFTGPSTVANIVSRVIGGSPSMIDGTLQSDLAGTHLYLLNPAGVVFGLHARLEVKGSFHVSTAEMLRLGEDGTFHVSPTVPSTLTMSGPSAFGFLREKPAGIRIEGSQFAVGSGQMLSIIGGDIDMIGERGQDDPATLAAPSGQIHLVSVASPGEAVLPMGSAALDVDVETFAHFGAIAVTEDALVDVSGEGGGIVRIRGAQLDVDDASIRANTEGDMPGGFLDVHVDSLTISNDGVLSANTHQGANRQLGSEKRVSIVATDRVMLSGNDSRIETLTSGPANAGHIELRTGQLSVTGGSEVISETTGKLGGRAGNVMIWADRVEITGGGTRVRSITRGSGDAGRVHIETEHLQVTRGRILGTAHTGSTGDSGAVTIIADTLIVEDRGRIGSILSGPGQGGHIDLTVEDLTLQSGGNVTTSVFSSNLEQGFKSGDAGQIAIRATGKIHVTGRDSIIDSSTSGSGNAGQISIDAEQISLTNSGRINSETQTGGRAGMITLKADRIAMSGGGSRIRSATRSSGDAGRIRIDTQHLEIINGSRIQGGAFTGSTGNAGEVMIDAVTLVIENGGRIASVLAGPGEGGLIDLTVQDLTVNSGSSVTSSVFSSSLADGFESGDAGKVVIRATGRVHVTGRESVISSSTNGLGNAGLISIDAAQISLTNNGKINSETLTGGRAGQITLQADHIEMSGNGSLIRSATRSRGNAGRVHIETQHLQITDGGRIQGGAFTGSTGNAGDVVIDADTLIVEDRGRIASVLSGPGEGGLIDLTVQQLTVQSGATITSSVSSDSLPDGFESGDAGTVVIRATGRVHVTGRDSIISSSTNGSGNAGPISIDAEQISITQNGRINSQTLTGGNAGEITLKADRIEMSGGGSQIRSATRSRGNAGRVHIETQHLQITDGGRIQGGAFTGSTGNAGDVVIDADTLIVEDRGRIASVLSGPGEGGLIDLTVQQLTVRSGGTVTSSVFSVSLPDGFKSGDAGTVVIRATDQVLVTGKESNISSSTRGTGKAGAITINAEQLLVTDEGQISTETVTSSQGGDIHIWVNEIKLTDLGAISTMSSSEAADAGAGGSIVVTAQGAVRLQSSEITASVVGGDGEGGDITVMTDVGLLERSHIRANAFGGPGGNITIQANGFITDINSQVSASSQQSVNGTVEIQGLADLSGSLIPINPSFASAATLLRDRCAGRSQGHGISRFTRMGRDRVPTAPVGLLPSPSVATIVAPIGQSAARWTTRLRQESSPPLPHLTVFRDCVR